MEEISSANFAVPQSFAIESRDLCFSYARQQAGVQNISLQIPRGVAFGLLGQNGAGKSTLLKLLTGLLRADSGTVYLMEKSLQHPHQEVFRHIGILIEEPSLYPHLSGYDNLKITCLYQGIPSQRIEEVLELVQLTQAGRQRVRSYSTGMKQRLGLALALLSDPELLMLDEPVNGMDPQGIVDMRNLIRQLHREGKTIVFSSHLLHEVELTCNHVGILQQGKLLYQGSIDGLKQQAGRQHHVFFQTNRTEEAMRLLTLHGFNPAHNHTAGFTALLHQQADISRIIDLLREADIDIYQVTPQKEKLEDVYLHLTRKS